MEAARVSITSHLEAPIIIQGALDSGAIAGSFNMISQQVVYVLAQAMADTNTVAIVRYVKKDDADPQVMVLRPNPSCVDATLYMYRIPFRVRYSISLFIHSCPIHTFIYYYSCPIHLICLCVVLLLLLCTFIGRFESIYIPIA